MKRWYGLLLPVFFSTSFLGGYAAPQDRQYVDYFLRLQAAELFRQKSFLLNWSCAYVNQNRLLGVDLCFSCYRSISINQARKLLVSVAEEIVAKINNDPSLHERNLLPEPFTLDQVYLKIETDNVFSAQADIETVQTMYLDRGNITYYSYPASTLFYGRVTKFEERIDQARMILGESVPFSGPPVLPREKFAPVPEEAPVPAKPFTRTIEPVEEALMTTSNEVQRITLDTENMLEEQPQDLPKKEEILDENLLGAVFDTVVEVFPDFREEEVDQPYGICRKSLPSTSFPEALKADMPRSISVEDICYEQKSPQKSEQQSWNDAKLPSSNALPLAMRTTDIDRPLSKATSMPYASTAVSSSSLPDGTEGGAVMPSELCWNESPTVPKHNGEILSNSTDDGLFTLGLVTEPSNSDENELNSLDSAESDAQDKPLDKEPSASFDTAQEEREVASDDMPNEVSTQPWYSKVMNWLHGGSTEAENLQKTAEDLSQQQKNNLSSPVAPEPSSLPPMVIDEESPQNLNDEDQEIPERAAEGILPSTFGQTGEESSENESGVSEITTPEKHNLLSWLLDGLKGSKNEEQRVDVAEEVAAIEELDAADVIIADDKGQLADEILSHDDPIQPVQEQTVQAESTPFFKRMFRWMRGSETETSVAEEQAVAQSSSTEVAAAAPEIALFQPEPIETPRAEGVAAPAKTVHPRLTMSIVPPPEIIDETQDDTPLEASSVFPAYQKVISWLRTSNESLSPEPSEAIIAEETSDREYTADDSTLSTPWYKSAMALFQGTPREIQEEEIADASSTDGGLSVAESSSLDSSSDLAEASSPANISSDMQGQGFLAKVKSWAFVAPRDRTVPIETCEPAAEKLDDEPLASAEESLDGDSSWLERLSDWVRGDTSEESTAEISQSNEVSSAGKDAMIATRLGDVERPDEEWEEIEDEMQGNDDDEDDETTKPGVMTRAFSTLHSLWQSAIGEAGTTDKQKSLDESTASYSSKKAIDPPEQSS